MADFDKSTFDPKAAAEARKKEMDQMAQKLEAGVKDIFQGENYKAYLDFCAKMPDIPLTIRSLAVPLSFTPGYSKRMIPCQRGI